MTDILADRTRRIDASGIRKVFALAATMKDPVNFSIGQPDFDVPDPLKRQAMAAIEQGFNSYSQTVGDAALRQRIAGLIESQFGWKDPATLVTSGVSGGLFLAFMALVNPGDEVIILDPYFVIYKQVVNLLGGRCVFVDSYPDFRLPVEGIRRRITDKTKLIVINSPCNPSGAVYSADELKALAQVAAEKGIVVLSDESYDSFCYDGPCPSIGSYHPRTLVLKGFSKAYAMTGWRLGYVASDPCLRPVVEAMTMMQQYTFVCAPTPFQKAAVAALDFDIRGYVEAYRAKRDLLYEGLRDRFELARPQGAFYAFVKAPSGTGTEFVQKAIAHNVLIIPGGVFSERDTHFRISFATSGAKIEQGIQILRGL